MFSIALVVKLLDENGRLIDKSQWPLVDNNREGWCRGMEKTTGTLFDTLTLAIRKYNLLEGNLTGAVPPTKRVIGPLLESITNVRQDVEKNLRGKLTFDLAIISHQQVTLESIKIDI